MPKRVIILGILPACIGMATEINDLNFSKWRRRLWPFHRSEFKKLFPLILIKFLISINYCILTNIKDTVTVTSSGSGAEVIAVLKGWVVLPAAMLIAFVYSKLSNILNKKKLFYTMMSGFLVVIFFYGFILYPNSEIFSPTDSSNWLISQLGSKYAHWVAVYRNWIHSLLFITAELWGSVVILVMFWGFANDVTSVDEAKRSYNIYIAAGDLAAFSIGPIVCFFMKHFAKYSFTIATQSLLALVLFVGLLVMAIFWWMNKYALTDKNFSNPMDYKGTPKRTKEKLSLSQGFKHLIKSKYLLGIAILVVGYGLSISLIEVTWKASVNRLYPNPIDFQTFTSKSTSCVGLFAFLTSVFLGSNIIRKFGWHFSAQLTPILVGATGVMFFIFVLNQNIVSPIAALFGVTPLAAVVLFGAFQNVISKVAKYSFFDPTKEMAYIPLDNEAKLKGKAAIDVVGSRLGKSGSAWIQIALIDLIGTGSIFSITHILLPIVSFVIISWILSVKSLSKQFEEKHQKQKLAVNSS
jgi:AAA family ATP:ADP antiporter